MGNEYIAGEGNVVYLLALGSYSKLYRIDLRSTLSKPEPLSDAPAIAIPQLPTASSLADLEVVYSEIEKRRIPVGIFYHSNQLFIATREPSAKGGTTDWLVHSLQPDTGTTVGRFRLPTTANHLTLVPTENFLLAFEKGRVDRLGRQSIASFIKVPAGWFNQQTSPLAIDNEAVPSCSRSASAHPLLVASIDQ